MSQSWAVSSQIVERADGGFYLWSIKQPQKNGLIPSQTMNPTVTPAAPIASALWPRIKAVVWHREVRIFLIHWAVWMAWDMIQAYFLMTYTTLDPGKTEFAFLVKFKGNLGGYFAHSLWINAFFLLTVHADYWLFRRLFRSEGIWRAVVFGVVQVLYLFFLAGFMGFLYGYFGLDIKSPGVILGMAFMWGYGLLFVGVRAFRHSRKERKQAEKQRVETEQRYRQDLERTRQEAEIAALKAQVNPHFLFNTLNNLYGTALSGDTDRTAAGIEQLSGVMRHIVEETKRDRTPIAKEIRFLEDTIDLHRMRLPQQDNIQIRAVMTWDEAPTPDGRPTEIAPLMLVSFIENAFKYGISLSAPCSVDIRLIVERGELLFTCRNIIMPHNHLNASTGTGIENIRQRLRLLYPDRHTLIVNDENGVFSVMLNMTL